MNKLLVIVGPTSSGKSQLAVKLAKKYHGEIICCDSRQIYKGMDLGTGKVAGIWKALPNSSHPECSEGSLKKYFIYKGIVHHLIDFVSPHRRYSVSLYQSKAQKVIADVLKRGKLPILCGGGAHWIDAVVYSQQLPDVKPNLKLRKELEKKSADVLYHQLKKLDPARAKSIDRFNKRRLIRALEIVLTTDKPVPSLSTSHYPLSTYDVTWLGLNLPQPELYKQIDERLKQRLKTGMVKEVQRLHSPSLSKEEVGGSLSWRRLESFGLEYKYISLYLQKKLAYDQMVSQLSYAIKHYAKKQMTWWKRNKNINWIKNYRQAEKMVEKYLQ